MQEAIAVYSSDELDLDDGGDAENNVHLKDWLKEGKERLDEAREALRYLCEPVEAPRQVEQFLRYFCGESADPDALAATEDVRVALYKAVATFVRAYAELSSDMEAAGYAQAEADAIRAEVDYYGEMRAAIKQCACEELDTKPFEADMRHLINTYIQAGPAQGLAGLADLSLTDLIIKTGIHDAIARRINEKGKLSKDAVAETIINNVRKTIIREGLTDPRFYEQMSQLLDDLIKQRRSDTQEYEEFLKKAEELVRRLGAQEPETGVPASLHGRREATVLFNNLSMLPATTFACPDDSEARAKLALDLDAALRERAPAGWKGDQAREVQVLNAIFPLLGRDRDATAALFEIVKHQAGY